jgi:hypothetical protein
VQGQLLVRARVKPNPAGAIGVPFECTVHRTGMPGKLVYLGGCFLYGVSALTDDPIVRKYFSTEFGVNYSQCVILGRCAAQRLFGPHRETPGSLV